MLNLKAFVRKLKTALYLVRRGPAGWKIITRELTVLIKIDRGFPSPTSESRAASHNWLPTNQLQPVLGGVARAKVLVVVHIFYKSYVDRLMNFNPSEIPNAEFDVIVTFSDEGLLRASKSELDARGFLARLHRNRGRHFGPFLSTLSQVETSKYDLILHLHSKKSPHAPKSFGIVWAEVLWEGLLENDTILTDAISQIMASPTIGIYYPEVLDLVGPEGYSWKGNKANASRLLSGMGFHPILEDSRFAYPAGGMFLIRPAAIRQLIDLKIDSDWFEDEQGALNGKLEHALERLVGYLPSLNGFQHLIYSSKLGVFTTDQSFINFAKVGQTPNDFGPIQNEFSER